MARTIPDDDEVISQAGLKPPNTVIEIVLVVVPTHISIFPFQWRERYSELEGLVVDWDEVVSKDHHDGGTGNRNGPLSLAMTANNEDNSQPPATPSEPKPLSTDTPPPNSPSELASSSSPPPTPDRSELLVRARHFLSSPQVIDQDFESKRRFLAEKGLTDGEIQLLLREMVRPVHALSPDLKTQYSMFMFPKAFAVARSATTDIPPTTSIPSARTSRRYLQGAFMASGRLHGSALYLLRAYAPTSHLSLAAQTRVNLAS